MKKKPVRWLASRNAQGICREIVEPFKQELGLQVVRVKL